jgi:hypothetical protein
MKQSQIVQPASPAALCYAVTAHGSVWMVDDQTCISAARAVAVDTMRALGMDEGDWRTRDNIIMAISDRINGMLDHVRHNVES